MNEPTSSADQERRLRNLHAVVRHRTQNPAGELPSAGRSRGWKRRLAALGPLGIVLIFVLGKLKLVIPLLKFTKLGTLLTMLVSIWAYAQLWGLAFGVGFVLLIFVHELGHVLVMKQQGIRASAPVFIPFVGAMIAMKSQPRNAYVEALVGIGGPVLGSIGALFCLIVAGVTGSLFWYALGSTGFLINLFNLIPISPLDGGRIVGVITRWLWVAGYAIGIAVFLMTYSPILFLILLLGLFELSRAMRGSGGSYYEIEPKKRVAMGVAYFALIVLLTLGMWIAGSQLSAIGSTIPS